MQYTIYPASAQHAQMLNDIHYQSWIMCYRGMIDDHFLDTMDSQRWTGFFQEALGVILKGAILEVDGKPAGCVTYKISDQPYGDGQVGEIVSFYFLPDFWGKGVSAALMQWVLDRLKEMKCSLASLWVLEQNKRARRFYEKMGFCLTSELLYSKIGDQETTDLRMLKTL